MYLKAIEMIGFKSFAQKTKLQFNDGITGIVGPNGSGKSNVADALRWVLGEQSVKQLRSGSMQDVIFTGTEYRKKLGCASVKIVFDNTDHSLPVDYEEVVIGRRVYQSGETEYLLNDSSCRLKDIQELFYDTGIGQEGYSIIGQGQIERVLSNRPEDRRELFDEAAGIVRYRKRKQEAVRKLEKEQQNVDRVLDILNELENQRKPLAIQAESAKQYLSLQEQLKIYEINIYLKTMTEIDEKKLTLEEKIAIVQEQLNELKKHINDCEDKQSIAEQSFVQAEKCILRLQEKQKEITKYHQKQEVTHQVLEEQVRSYSYQIQQKENRQKELKQIIQNVELKQENLIQQQEALQIQQQQRKQEQQGIYIEQQKLEQKIHQIEEQTSAESGQYVRLLKESTDIKLQQQNYFLQNKQIEQEFLEKKKDIVLLYWQEQNICQKISFLDMKYHMQQSKISKIQRILQSQQKQQSAVKQQIETNEKDIMHMQKHMHMLQAKYEALDNLAQRYEGYGNAVKQIMKVTQKFPGIHGTVAQIIQTESIYELAIETALGSALQNIITDTEYTAKDCIEYLKKYHYGRATFLPLTTIQSKTKFTKTQVLQEHKVINIASELVHVDKQYRTIIQYLLGRIIVVEDLDIALSLARKYQYSFRIVTLAGEQLNIGGSVTGGAYKQNSNLLGRNRELEDLQIKLKEEETEYNILKKQIIKLQNLQEEVQQSIIISKENLQTYQISFKETEMILQQNQSQLQECKQQLRIKKQQLIKLKDTKQQIVKESEEIVKREQKINCQITEFSEQCKRLEPELKQLRIELEKVRKQVMDKQLEVERLEQKQQLFIQQGIENKKQQQDADIEKIEILKELTQLQSDVSVRKKEIETAKLQMQQAKAQLIQLERELEEKYVIKNTETALQKVNIQQKEELQSEFVNLDKENLRLEQQKNSLQENLEQQINYLWTTYEMTPSETVSYQRKELQNNQLAKLITQLKHQIKELGLVNVNAIEEYNHLEERYTFLNGQYQDLEIAKKQLQHLIHTLDEGMRKQFEENFIKINEAFNEVFNELFGGGKGSLSLVTENSDNKDILEAGIQVIAQPPGKKLQNMMQMSGGEKALTAISLLFAIQKLKPTPFCLLDEIEAALDDANITRFAEYLQKLKRHTQFIVITHRKGTMLVADQLYGVTMQEKGISSLVSVSLEN